MAKQKIVIEQEQPGFVEGAIEVIASLGGWAVGGIAGVHLHKMLPIAKTTIEQVGRVTTIGAGVLVTEHYTAKAIEEELTSAHESVVMAKLLAKGILSKGELKEATEESANNTTKK